MDLFLNKDVKNSTETKIIPDLDFIEKEITANDVRARIVSIPSVIMNKFSKEQDTVKVCVNDEKYYSFNIIRGRNYFGSVTTFLKEFDLLSDEGVITSKQSKWYYDAHNEIVKIYLEE